LSNAKFLSTIEDGWKGLVLQDSNLRKMKESPMMYKDEPEASDRCTDRREALRKAAALGIAAAAAPVALGFMARDAFAQAMQQQIMDALNFALTLEYLEDEFYRTALDTVDLIPEATRPVFEQIARHESAHVALLETLLGESAAEKPAFDFTAGGLFAPFTDYTQFLLLAQAFEDAGVRAYKGQAANLIDDGDILTTALQIHSVEARHASIVRRINGSSGWISFDETPAPEVAAVYAGGGNTMHAGTDASSSTSVSNEAVTEAFDEPLTREEVHAIASLFIV
jgi:rubrerythrin